MNNKGEKTLLVRDELDFVPKKRIQDHQLLTKHTLTSCFKHLDGESVEWVKWVVIDVCVTMTWHAGPWCVHGGDDEMWKEKICIFDDLKICFYIIFILIINHGLHWR